MADDRRQGGRAKPTVGSRTGSLELRRDALMNQMRTTGYTAEHDAKMGQLLYGISRSKAKDIADATAKTRMGTDPNVNSVYKGISNAEQVSAATVRAKNVASRALGAVGKIGKAAVSAVNKTLGVEFGMVLDAVPSPLRAKSAEMKSLDELRKAADKVY